MLLTLLTVAGLNVGALIGGVTLVVCYWAFNRLKGHIVEEL